MRAATSLLFLLFSCNFYLVFSYPNLPFHRWKFETQRKTANALRQYELLKSNIVVHMRHDRGNGIDIFHENSKQDVILDDFDHILDAIYMYKKIFGDLKIPVKYEVPNNSPWPLHLHGLRLGKRLEKLLSTPDFFDEYPDKVEELEKRGFSPTLKSLVDDWDLIYDAMKVCSAS